MRSGAFHGEVHLRSAVIALSFASIGISTLFVLSPLPAPTIAQLWRAESLALLGVLLLPTTGMFFTRRLLARLFLLAIRLAVVTVVSIPFGDAILMKVPLWSSL